MKTLRIALIAALVVFTMVNLASADGFKEKPKTKKIVNLSFEKAMTSPGLVAAMYAQIGKEELLHNIQNTYIAEAIFQGNIFRIKGTRAQWIWFFKIKGELPINLNKGIGTS